MLELTPKVCLQCGAGAKYPLKEVKRAMEDAINRPTNKAGKVLLEG